MGERAPWIKLWCDYTSTPSHDELDAHAMWVGVVLMLLVRAGNSASPEETTWALQPTGKPYTIAGIAQRARLRDREVKSALEALERAGTVARREDGAWGLPQFWKFQRASSTERMARKRRREEVTPDVTPSSVNVTGQSVTLESQIATLPRSLRSPESTPNPASGERLAGSSGISNETRAEAEAIGRSFALEPEPTKPKPKVTAKPRLARAELPDGLAEHVLVRLVQACQELDGPGAGPRHNAQHEPFLDDLRKLQAAHMPTLEDWTAVIAERQRLTQDARNGGEETYGTLTIGSLCVPRNFERWLASSRDRARRNPPRTSSVARGPAPPSPRPTVGGRVDLRRSSGDDDGQAGAA